MYVHMLAFYPEQGFLCVRVLRRRRRGSGQQWPQTECPAHWSVRPPSRLPGQTPLSHTGPSWPFLRGGRDQFSPLKSKKTAIDNKEQIMISIYSGNSEYWSFATTVISIQFIHHISGHQVHCSSTFHTESLKKREGTVSANYNDPTRIPHFISH